MRNETAIPPALAATSAGRDHINTREYALSITKAPQTVRKLYCTTGEAYGIRPKKIGNNLLWPVAEISKLLNGGV